MRPNYEFSYKYGVVCQTNTRNFGTERPLPTPFCMRLMVQGDWVEEAGEKTVESRGKEVTFDGYETITFIL